MLRLREVPDGGRADWIETLAARQDALRFRNQFDDPAVSAAQAREFVSGAIGASRVFEVVEDDASVGHLWWGQDGDAAAVMDVRLDEPDRMTDLLPLLLDLAREEGRGRIGSGGLPADPSRMALIALPGFTARATNMALRLDGAIDGPVDLVLQEMTRAEFDEFHGRMADDYAAELAAAGLAPDEARTTSRTQLAELIPEGLASPGQEFFTAWVAEQPVGHLWLSTQRPMAFVYDIVVRDEQRRKGYGAAIMNAGAVWSRDHGHVALGLNVFAHNPGARVLYDRLGYQVTVDYRTIDVPDAG